MTFKTIFGALAIALTACTASNTVKTAELKVWGNCGMCKKTIEKSLNTEGISAADWNKDTKVLTVKFDTTKTNLQQIATNVANAGYDNELQRGNDEAYKNLHECCQYERK